MKALFRLFVLCFFFLHFGLAFAGHHAKVEPSYVALDRTFTSVQISKKAIDFIGGQTLLQAETNTVDDRANTPIHEINFASLCYSFIAFGFNSTTFLNLGVCQLSGSLQQNRARYLVFQSLKIPH